MIELFERCSLDKPSCTSNTTENEQGVLRIYNSEIPYCDFFFDNLEGNEPCIFEGWLTQAWPARRKWVTAQGSINYDFLEKSFGNVKVDVADCSEKYFDSQKKIEFTFSDYTCYMKGDRHKSTKCLYLKDWHFVKEFPDYGAYLVPPFFASDWLNEFWSVRSDASHDDYKFVYIGPAGSWTPFHADVFRSFSWSSNICGRKRWVLYPPSEELNLMDTFGNLIYDLDGPELRDKFKFPKAGDTKGVLDIIQESGQTIFVPSKWYHQVWNLEDTVSINHNWINGTNILIVWEFLLSSLRDVEKSIEDCRSMDGWTQQCQMILKSIVGMNFREYFYFLKTIAHRRLKYLEGDVTLSSYPCWQFGKSHVMYDVGKLVTSLERLIDDPHFDELDFDDSDSPMDILDLLQAAL